MRSPLLAIATLLLASVPALASTIDFNIPQGGFYPSPLTSYTESGYTVLPTAGTFYYSLFGQPGYSIYTQGSGTVTVTNNNRLMFNFSSLAIGNANLYSGTVSYTISGLLNGQSVFSQSGVNPTLDSFLTVASVDGGDPIDTLVIGLTGASTNIDNIVVSGAPAVASTPEPSSIALLATGMLGFARLKRRRSL